MFHASLRGGPATEIIKNTMTTNDAVARKPTLDVAATWKYFAQVSGKAAYGNKADFNALERVFLAFKNLGYDTRDTVVLIGGTNKGQSSVNILQRCPNITLYGFEIQPDMAQQAKQALHPYAGATVINMGWSDQKAQGLSIGGRGEAAGLFDPQGQRGWKVQQDVTASTVRLDEWVQRNNVKRVAYTLIDTEGHEPSVIRGMALEQTYNQQRFPMFQYELGGTWAARDHRHNNDAWDQVITARHLEEAGYRLFLLGTNNWLAVTADFFVPDDNNPAINNERFGPFVQGNVLALHSKYAPKDVASTILNLAVVFET